MLGRGLHSRHASRGRFLIPGPVHAALRIAAGAYTRQAQISCCVHPPTHTPSQVSQIDRQTLMTLEYYPHETPPHGRLCKKKCLTHTLLSAPSLVLSGLGLTEYTYLVCVSIHMSCLVTSGGPECAVCWPFTLMRPQINPSPPSTLGPSFRALSPPPIPD